MKKSLLLLALSFVLIVQNALAMPAYPHPVEITQPDGSTLTIQRFGDEFFSYTLTVDGYQIQEQADGFYYYYTPALSAATKASEAGTMRVNEPTKRGEAERNFVATLSRGVDFAYQQAGVAQAQEMHDVRNNLSPMPRLASPMRTAALLPKKALVIVAQFPDKLLSGYTTADFHDLLNKEGYNRFGAVGSARDYFMNNSRGEYQPDFDVAAVVTLPNTYAYYGANQGGSKDVRPAQMIYDACAAADSYVNFADYDSNNDGEVDNVFVFYAGYNEAEGASASTIWPHRWSIYPGQNIEETSARFDNVEIFNYACTSELRGTSGTTLAGIGTFCHEFGHILGLPDYYDTDYAVNGQSVGLYNLNIMSSGGYNGNGSVPPAYGAIERAELGWLTLQNIADLPDGDYEIQPCTRNEVADALYYIPSEEAGEMFLLESRAEESWDATMTGEGLVITQWDNRPSNNYASLLAKNTVNTNPNHMSVRYRESYGTTLSSSYSVRISQLAYPGEKKRDAFTIGSYGFEGWNGAPLSTQLLDIKVEDGVTKFTKITESDKTIYVSNITQVSASIRFIMAGAEEWTLKYQYEGGEAMEKSGLKGTETNLTKLVPGKTYTLEAINSYGDSYTDEFTTLQLTDTTPAMAGVQNKYTVGDTYLPSVVNIIDSYVGMDWVLGGSNVSASEPIKFETPGSFVLQCEIVYTDGSSEKIQKEIFVTE